MNAAVAPMPQAGAPRGDGGMDRTPPLVLVQVLRGIAALLVLTGHTQGSIVTSAAAIGVSVWTIPHLPSGLGVDLFFCISGFIMIVSSGRFFGTSNGWRRFLARRAIRLVPLYWCFTLAYLPILLGGRHGFHGNLPTALVTSLAFIPYPASDADLGGVFPLYSLGWSLNFEMFFYLVFSLFLFLPRGRAVAGVCGVLVLVVLAGAVFQPSGAALSVWTAPIVLEFCLGLGIGLAWLGSLRVPGWACGLLCVTGLALLFADPFVLLVKTGTGTTPNDFHRVFGWGVPAAAMLASAVFLEKTCRVGGVAVATLQRLGDASYSLYLAHPIVLQVLARLWAIVAVVPVIGRLTTWPAWGLVLIGSAIAVGLATHRWLEQPMTQRLNNLRLRRRTAPNFHSLRGVPHDGDPLRSQDGMPLPPTTR